MDLFAWNPRDALLLAFAELESYGIATRASAAGSAAEVRADLAGALSRSAPHGLGSYAFWLRSDAHLFARGGIPPVHTSGPEVDLAVAAALDHQGLGIRPAA